MARRHRVAYCRRLGRGEVILLDTHALVFDALAPDTLSRRARQTIDEGDAAGNLACSDISLWEIAMLISKERIKIPMPITRSLSAWSDSVVESVRM